MQKGRFVKNAAIMTASALILRTVGMFFRVWLADRIGSEGMGLYQLIFSVYMLAATFATGGISTAVTRLVAEELEKGTPRSVKQILSRAIGLTLAVGVASTALVAVLADPIAAGWIKDPRAAMSLRILSLSLPFMGISGCLKGYFMGRRKAMPPSNAQLFEQLVRMAIIFVIIGRFAEKGLAYACAAVLLGDTVSEAASCGFLWLVYRRDRSRLTGRLGARPAPPYGVVRKLLSLSLPLVGGRYLTTGLRTAESLMVPACLAAFAGSREWAVSQYGLFKGMAMPVIFFLSSFLTALSTLLVPELSSALASGDPRQVQSPVKRSVQLTLTASVWIGGVFFWFGRDVGLAFYHSAEVGELVRWLAPLIPWMYLESVVTGMLNGLDQQKHIFWYNVIDSGLRLAAIPLLVPRWGMVGFFAVTYASNLLTSLLCLIRLLKVAKTPFMPFVWLIRPLLCTVASVTVGAAVAHFCGGLSPIPRLIAESGACLAVYLPLMMVTGGGQDALRWVNAYAARKRQTKRPA